MSDRLNIDPKAMYMMTIVYKKGNSEQKRVKGKNLARTLAKHNGNATVLQATARKL